jgi:hypothetical protein
MISVPGGVVGEIIADLTRRKPRRKRGKSEPERQEETATRAFRSRLAPARNRAMAVDVFHCGLQKSFTLNVAKADIARIAEQGASSARRVTMIDAEFVLLGPTNRAATMLFGIFRVIPFLIDAIPISKMPVPILFRIIRFPLFLIAAWLAVRPFA